MPRVQHPDHDDHRLLLRFFGLVLVLVGGGFTVVGLISFFSAFEGGGWPEQFWCAFVGLPLLSFGTMLLKAGYLGAMSRYVAGETAPVVADTADYVLQRTRGVLRVGSPSTDAALRSDAENASPRLSCPACQAPQRAAAKFCDLCGAAMASERECPACHHENAAAARFCNHCGEKLDT